MDGKGVFDHVPKSKLAQRMRQLGIDNDLIGWTQLFLTDRKAKIVIDGYVDQAKYIEIGIPQASPVSPISFLIYISGVFDRVTATTPKPLYISNMDDLGFLASKNSAQEVVIGLEKTGEAVIQWGLSNAVTYDIAKTEVILFSRACSKKAREKIAANKLVFGEQKVFYFLAQDNDG